MASAETSGTGARRRRVTGREAILTGWLCCGVLDITAACLQAWIQSGRAPADVLRGVASALWGRAAMTAGSGMAAIGLAMHFTVALTEENGTRRSFRTVGDTPRVEVHDPLQPHRELLRVYTDADIHNVTAFMVTLK